MRNLFFLFLIIFFTCSFVSSASFGYDNPNLPKIIPEEVKVITSSTGSTNSSNYWDDLDVPLPSWLVTYNETYNLWAYNQTTATFNMYNAQWNSTYNVSYNGCLNNESYLSTYNATYDALTGGSGYAPTNINLTAGTYNGSLGGYSGANTICDAEFPGSHFCNEFEITLGFSNNASISINNSDAWCETGGPKYIPATVPVDSCGGWTYSETTTHLGNYWHFDNVTGGVGRAINCGTELKLCCATY
jgi:hypothetical protein